MQALLRRTLPVHAAFYAGPQRRSSIVIWALTTRAYFWPEWTLMPLAMPLAIHAWTVFVDRGDPRRIARTRALAIDLGAATTLFLFFVGIWAVTTRAYFWPMWPGLGLAVVVGLHALSTMTRRIDVLTTTRAGAVNAAEDELRRIERDLHDGAQARLVALGMSIGMAEQKLRDDPEAARQLLAEARAGAGEALSELRDLARGIHPPILTDRGLAAALAALVARGPLPVDVHVELTERPPATVESAAYFVAAEALANAAQARRRVAHRHPDRPHGRLDHRHRARRRPRRRRSERIGPARAARPRRGARRDVPRREPARWPHDRRGGAALRVVIAEDLALLRDGLTRLLRDNGFDVVAAVDDGDALVHAVQLEEPDIAIVDVRLPPTFTDEGVRAALEARRLRPKTAILIVSQYVEHAYADELLADGRGGVGYLLKDRIMDVGEFVEAVRRVAAGGTALDPEVVAQLFGQRRRAEPLTRLTPREREVLGAHGGRPLERGHRRGARPHRRRGREARREHPPEARAAAVRERPPARARRARVPQELTLYRMCVARGELFTRVGSSRSVSGPRRAIRRRRAEAARRAPGGRRRARRGGAAARRSRRLRRATSRSPAASTARAWASRTPPVTKWNVVVPSTSGSRS